MSLTATGLRSRRGSLRSGTIVDTKTAASSIRSSDFSFGLDNSPRQSTTTDSKEVLRVNIAVALCSVAIYLAIAAALCVFGGSNDAARLATHTVGLRAGYLSGWVAFTTYLAQEIVTLLLHADSDRQRTVAQPLAIAICGTTSAALHSLGLAPVWATPQVDDNGPVLVVTPLRHLTWCFTTSLLAFSTWRASGLPLSHLTRSIAVDVPMILTGLVSSVTRGWVMAVFYAASCVLFIAGLVVKWDIQGAILADCHGLDSAKSAILRMRYVSVVVWCLFPVADALHRVGAIGNMWAELLTSGSDVFAKCILSGALKHGILCTGEDRKRLRLQGVSVTLVEQLRQQERRKDRFFSAMTHELRTPLNGIIGLIDMLLLTETSLSPKCRQSLRSASETGRRFQNLIDSILDHAAMQESKLTLHRQPMSVHHLVDEVSVLIEPIVSKRTELRVQLPAQLPLLYGDYNRLIQVLFNLMGNAAKFTDSGHITVSATEDGRMLELTVSDTGIGIPEEHLSTIFEPFEQVDSGHSRSYGGAGLGLSLALSLVNAHGGTLKVQSVPGIGTRFAVRLPVHRSSADPNDTAGPSFSHRVGPPTMLTHTRRGSREDSAEGWRMHAQVMASTNEEDEEGQGEEAGEDEPAPAPAAVVVPQQDLPRDRALPREAVLRRGQLANGRSNGIMRRSSLRAQMVDWARRPEVGLPGEIAPSKKGQVEILSVDDDELNQEVIMELMATGNFSVTRVLSARDAVDLLAERFAQAGLEAFPDIILMDLMMPGMTGLEATRLIRETYPTCNVPIIMVSAVNSEKDICAGLQAGCNDYVTKPFRHMELMARVGLQLRIVQFYRKELEAKQHERILQEILPLSVIDRLKTGQNAIADELQDVTVIFSDIVGFTELAASHSTPSIIGMLDQLFTAFDNLVERFRAYKVETIGDAYMIACGLDEQAGHASTAIDLGAQMIRAASGIMAPNGSPVRIRVGVHSGPAYAGVVGQKCPRYCLFGDTVNTASRMESNGFPMTVHISDSTLQRAMSSGPRGHGFHSLGRRMVKGKGPMQTWLVKAGEWEEAVRTFDATLDRTSSDHGSCISSP